MAVIANVFAPACLLGQDPLNIERIVARMDFLAQAKALVDYALLDSRASPLGSQSTSCWAAAPWRSRGWGG